jgi:16S rRNA (guanine527-N7)-methyltransferase
MNLPADRLNVLLADAGLATLDAKTSQVFQRYLSLILRWNARINLTSLRDEEQILSRHFVESIACAQALPREITTLLDFGSGAGLPGIPIALCRPELAVTLAESQGKKAAFLQEAVRELEIAAHVHVGRAETLAAQFDCVALRAVDRMALAVTLAARLVAPGGWLALMTTEGDVERLAQAAGPRFSWKSTALLENNPAQLLALGHCHLAEQISFPA